MALLFFSSVVRRAGAALGVLALAAAPVPAQPDVPADAPADLPGEPARPDDLTRRETIERLGAPVEVAFEGQALHDIIRYLSLLTDVPLEPLWAGDALEGDQEVGLDPMLPIDVDARGQSALACLDMVLAKAAEAQGLDSGATWQFNARGIIEFGPRQRLNRPGTLRAEVYDVQDILATLPPPPVAPRLNVSQALQSPRGGGSSGGWIFPGDITEAPQPPEQGGDAPVTPAEQLIQLITTLVEPEQWVINGGEAGVIRFHDGALIILAPDYMHRGLVGPFGGTDLTGLLRTELE